MKQFKLFAILLMAILATAAFADPAFTQIDRFDKGLIYGISKTDSWYLMAWDGATISNAKEGDNYTQLLNQSNVLEILDINVDPSSGPSWKGAGAGIDFVSNAEGFANGYGYDLRGCTDFEYEYKGNDHNICFQVKGSSYPNTGSRVNQKDEYQYMDAYCRNISSNATGVTSLTDNWHKVAITPTSLYKSSTAFNIADLGKVLQLQWRFENAVTTHGNLQVKNLKCIGKGIFMEPSAELIGKYKQTLGSLNEVEGYEGYSWDGVTSVSLDGPICEERATPCEGGIAWNADNNGNKFYFKKVFATYNGDRGAVTISVIPTDAVAPTDLTAKYGQTLSDVALPEDWEWLNGTTPIRPFVLGATNYKAKYIGDNPLINPTPLGGIDVSVDVGKADGVWKDNIINIIYSEELKLSGLTLGDGYTLTVVDVDVALSAGNEQEFAATYENPNGFYEIAEGKIVVNVTKARTNFVPIETQSITYEPDIKLSNVALPSTLYSWDSPNATLNVSLSGKEWDVTYTKNNNYFPVSGKVVVVVNKKAGTFGTHDAINTTYTTTLKLSDLDLKTSTTGYAWVEPTTTLDVSKSGQSFAATFTDPSGNYEAAEGTIVVNVAKARGTWQAHAAITETYTPTLKLSVLDLHTTTTGYAWVEPTTTLDVSKSGQSFAATYTDPSGNYEAAEGTIVVNVRKATTDFVSTAVTAVNYATGLTLNGVALPSSQYTWKTPGTSLNAGAGQTFPAIYTKDANYEPVEGTLTVTVNKATGLALTNSTPYTVYVSSRNNNVKNFDLEQILLNKPDHGDLNYAVELDVSHGDVLTLVPMVEGKNLVYQRASTAAPEGNVTGVKIDITSQNYSETVVVRINFTATGKDEVTIAGLTTVGNVNFDTNPQRGVTGSVRATSEDNGFTDIGSLIYIYKNAETGVESSEPPINVGSYALIVSVPESNPDYYGSKTYPFVINKANKTFPALTLSPTYSPSLTAISLLTPELAAAGYAWTGTTVLNAINHQIDATFTDPSGNYNVATGKIAVNVAKADVEFASIAALSKTYEQNLKLSGIALPDEYTWKTPGTSLNAGNGQTFTAIYTKNANYNPVEGDVTVNVAKATVVASLTWPTAGAGYLDMPLSKSVLTGGNGSQYGTYAWVDGTTELNAVGTASYAVVFTPKPEYSATNYNWPVLTSNVSIVVKSLQQQVNDVVAGIDAAVVNTPAIPFAKTGTAPNEKYEATLASLGNVGSTKAALDAYAASFIATLTSKLTEAQLNALTLSVAGTGAVATDEDEIEADLAKTANYIAATTGAAGSYTFYVKVKRNPYAYVGPFVVTIPKVSGSSSSYSGTPVSEWNGCTSYPCTSTPPKVTPILPPKVAISKISVRVMSNAITLENLPSNAKVEVYSMQGKRIYSSNAINSQVLNIQTQAGMYVIKVSLGSETKVMRVSLK